MSHLPATTSPIPLLETEIIATPEPAEIELTSESRSIMAEEDAAYEQEYDQAVVDLQQEQHQSLGLVDTIKTMFMWMESPEERVSKNRSHPTDPT